MDSSVILDWIQLQNEVILKYDSRKSGLPLFCIKRVSIKTGCILKMTRSPTIFFPGGGGGGRTMYAFGPGVTKEECSEVDL